MSFKLLAIRPLEGTDPKFLKNLRPNCIYKFYNDYYYLDKNGNRLDEYNDDRKFEEVVNITNNKTVPQNLYGDNINISALVGKNGSGKSSLLEMLYHHISCFEVDTNFDESEFEIYIESESLIYKIRSRIKINTEFAFANSIVTFFILENKNFVGIKEKENVDKIKKTFFTNVINYSIYGLNESIGGEWISEIFRKNDAYKTPITINPYREYGNINVNKEYLLAQQRMILNHYVIKNKNILEGYKLTDIVYTIDLYKTQKIFYKKKSKEENINTIKYIKNLITVLYGKDKNGLEEFVNLIFKSFNINNEKILL